MDNTQIRHSLCGNATGFYRISEVETLMELARADERAKMQGVDVWVSWDSERIQPIWMTNNEPIEMDLGRYNINNSFAYTQINLHFTKCILKISSGECAKFRIVRCL